MMEVEQNTSQELPPSHIVFAMLEYLQELLEEGTIPSEEAESLEVATQCLSSLFGVDMTNEEHKKSFSLKPQNLATIVAVGLTAKEKLSQALEHMKQQQKTLPTPHDEMDHFELRFYNYLQAAKKKGLFAGITPGTPEYEERYKKAREKFIISQTKKETKKPESPVPKPATPPTQHTTPPPQNKELAEKHKMEGNSKLAEKKYTEAIECYTRAIELDSTNEIYYSNRAAAYSSIGDHEAAIQDCHKSIAINPNYPKAYSRLGLAQFKLGRLKESIDTYKKGIELEPNNDNLKQSLAAAQRALQEKSGGPKPTPNPTPSGPAPGTPNLSEMLNNPDMMSGLSSMLGRGGGGGGAGGLGGGGGGGGLASILSNPGFQNMAQQMMANPAFMSMAQNFMRDPSQLSGILNTLNTDLPQDEQPQQQQTPPPSEEK